MTDRPEVGEQVRRSAQGRVRAVPFNNAWNDIEGRGRVSAYHSRSTRYSICGYIMDGGGARGRRGVEWGWSLSMMAGELRKHN